MSLPHLIKSPECEGGEWHKLNLSVVVWGISMNEMWAPTTKAGFSYPARLRKVDTHHVMSYHVSHRDSQRESHCESHRESNCESHHAPYSHSPFSKMPFSRRNGCDWKDPCLILLLNGKLTLLQLTNHLPAKVDGLRNTVLFHFSLEQSGDLFLFPTVKSSPQRGVSGQGGLQWDGEPESCALR